MKYFIITYGCQMNKSDSERIAADLEKKGYKPALNEKEADLILVNMCSVRQSAVDRVYGKMKNFAKLRAEKAHCSHATKLKIILTGCVLKQDKKKFQKGFDLIVNKEKYLDFIPKRQDKNIAFVPISNGCNNFCTYCVVPFTRGRLICRNHKEILKEVKDTIKRGFKEVWLLGQNVNDYQSPAELPSMEAKVKKRTSSSSPADPKINFAKLLKMIDDIPGDFKILFTSPHPSNFSNELINSLAKCKKFGQYLNLPVQSGDNKILKKMNRNYTVKEYKNLVKKIRKKIPQIKLSTDAIVGFLGETKSQFQKTVKLFKEIKFDWAYISKYSPRSGTAAFKSKDSIPLSEKKKREKILRKILKK